MQVVPRLSVEPMRYEDIAAVQAIERQVFASPWPKNAYASELSQNRQASYIVLRQERRHRRVCGALAGRARSARHHHRRARG